MNNAVLFLMYNQTPEQLALTKEALVSIQAQDVPVDIFAVDNGSTDDTWEWLQTTGVACFRNPANRSPVAVTNEWLGDMFGRMGYEHVLAVPNDVVLPKNLLREFLRWPRGVVTGSMTTDRNVPLFETSAVVNTCTPLCVALYRKWMYQALISKDGYFFCPEIVNYASDMDIALRFTACGIIGCQLDIQYFHFGSASWRMLPQEKGRVITNQADVDRATFRHRWGFGVTDAAYGESAQNINFRGDPKSREIGGQ